MVITVNGRAQASHERWIDGRPSLVDFGVTAIRGGSGEGVAFPMTQLPVTSNDAKLIEKPDAIVNISRARKQIAESSILRSSI